MKRGILFVYSIFFVLTLYTRLHTVHAAEQIVKGDTRHTEFYVITVPIPKCLPQFIVEYILEIVGRAWPSNEYKQPVFLDRAGTTYYIAQFAKLPNVIQDQMKFANRDTEKQPDSVAGRICVYVDGKLHPISDKLLSKTPFTTASTDPRNTIEFRSGLGILAAFAPRYSIDKTEYDRRRDTLTVDVEDQIPCDVASPRDTKLDLTQARKGENIFKLGNAQAALSALQAICNSCRANLGGACCPCTDYELHYKGTGLDGWMGTSVALTGTNEEKEKAYLQQVNYPITTNEKSAGKTISEIPWALEIQHDGEILTGGANVQPMCTEITGCDRTPQSSQYAQSYLLRASLADNCIKMPSGLEPDYFGGILSDADGKPLSQNACLWDYRKPTKQKVEASPSGAIAQDPKTEALQ